MSYASSVPPGGWSSARGSEVDLGMEGGASAHFQAGDKGAVAVRVEQRGACVGMGEESWWLHMHLRVREDPELASR